MILLALYLVTVFGYRVSDPERYGVAEFDEQGNCLSIEEKPQHPKSNYAVVGLYFYPNKVVEVAKHTHDSLSEASTFIEVLEKRQGLKVACLEDICFLYWMKEVDLHTHLIWLMPLSPYWIG